MYFFLDKLRNLERIPFFNAVATTLHASRCSLSLILQELSQLVDVYGPDKAHAIYSGGMSSKLFYSALDIPTCEYIERGQVIQATRKLDAQRSCHVLKLSLSRANYKT